MSSDFLQHKNSTIHYQKFGHGEKLLLCFHGFGESAGHFEFLSPAIKEDYTVIAIDFPYHGETIWKEKLLIEIPVLLKWIDQLLEENGKEKFSLMGYSMGGRIAMVITQNIPQKIEALVLCAPDGLKVNTWYWFATQTWLGNRLFKYTMRKPKWFFNMVAVAKKIKLVNEPVAKFVHYSLDNATKRKQVYEVWTAMRKFRPQLLTIKSLLVQYHIRTHLLFGKHDRVITIKNGYKFSKTIEGVCRISVLDAGHQFMNHKHVTEITSSLLEADEI